MAEQQADQTTDQVVADSPETGTGNPDTADDMLTENAPGNLPSDASGPASGTDLADTGDVKTPQFQPLTKSEIKGRPVTDVSRLNEVKVVVSAELGRTRLPIQQLLSLSDGSVIELNRNVDAPVELMAQGVPLGNGEVVVVDDCFAIRIKEIYSSS